MENTWQAIRNALHLLRNTALTQKRRGSIPPFYQVLRQAILSLCYVGLFFTVTALALDPTKPIHKYALQAWGNQQGLIQATVEAVAQTSEGDLWLATQEGVVRFDVVKFTCFDKYNPPELKSNWIQNLYVSRDNSLWITGREIGILRYQNGKLINLSQEPQFARGATGVFEDRQGTLWFTRYKGVVRLRAGQYTVFENEPGLPGGRITGVTEDSAGHLWFGNENGAIEFDHQ